jgi:nicotinamidase-related amidase
MAVTTLDPKTALVIIDLQKGIVDYPTTHPIAEIAKQAGALADAFRGHGLPVVGASEEIGRHAGRHCRRRDQQRRRGDSSPRL